MEQLHCPYFKTCGACTQLNTPYETQLEEKKEQVKQTLLQQGIGANVNPSIGMFYPYRYRNKLHLALNEGKNGEVYVGFYEENSNRVVDVQSCLLNGSWADVIIQITKQFVKRFRVKPFSKKTQKGVLRYVVARQIDQAVLVTLVATTNELNGLEWYFMELTKHFKAAGLYLNINNRTDNAVFDDGGFQHLFGLTTLTGKMLNVQFRLSPNSFFQVNQTIAEKIYKHVLSIMQQGKHSFVLDLFSGIGITSLIFAKNGAKVTSIESSSSAVNDAKSLIFENKLQQQIYAICGKCEDVMSEWAASASENQNLQNSMVFLDPPRLGVQRSVLEAVLSIQPKTIVYLSCNPITLARDLKDLLHSKQYELTLVQPYDMFPHTTHVETLAVLTKMEQ